MKKKAEENRLGNLRVCLIEDKQGYVDAITLANRKYDVVIIDGSHRYKCALMAPEPLADSGLIILDDAARFLVSARALREAGLLQMDMSGFGAIAKYTWTTTLFFRRNFTMASRATQQPSPSIRAVPVPKNLEQELEIA